MALDIDGIRETITDFLSNSGGRRGRSQNEARRASSQAPAPEEPADGQDHGGDEDDGDGQSSGSDTHTDETTHQPTNSQAPTDAEDEEVIDELYHRIDSLETELQDNDAQLDLIQDSQEQVAERVEDVNDTIRQLVGIYDLLANDVNPFTGDGEEDGGFGVFDDAALEDDNEEDLVSEFEEAVDEEEDTVSFDDLKELIDSAEDDQSEEADSVEAGAFEEALGSAEPVDDQQRTRDQQHREDKSDGSVTLHSIPDTYAADVIIFEWMNNLVETGGTATTLRAISYYEEIGWIGSSVRRHLENLLSGPDLDIHVDPGSTPEELTAEDHADSYMYIMKLNEVDDTLEEITR